MAKDKLHGGTAILIGGVIAAVFSVAAALGILRTWQWKLSDSFYVGYKPYPYIILVAIDDRSIQQIGRWPWKRSVHADLIRTISEAGPRAIGYDVNFPESSEPEEDAKLGEAVRAAGNVVLPYEVTLVRSGGELLGIRPLYPLAEISGGARLGYTNTPADADGIFRRIPGSVRNQDGSVGDPFFDVVFETYSSGKRELPEEFLINYAGPAGTFPYVSVVDVLERKVSLDRFRDAIVLVGATAPDLHDELFTPTGKNRAIPGIEVHASALNTIIGTEFIRDERLPAVVATIFFLALGCAFLVSRFRLRVATPLVLLAALAYALAAFVIFDLGIILNLLYPLAALACTYVAIVLLRYRREQREKAKLRSTLQQYVSAQVATHLIHHPEKLVLGGEAREMTVLFSDLRGFTSLSEKIKPDELVRILNGYLDEMTEIVFKNEGVLDKYMGDAVMAFWGAPIDADDHALRAVRTAVGMRDRLHALNHEGRWPAGVELRLGVGVNTGPMVVGNMGSKRRFDYTVMGDAVNLGSRLEGLNKEYGTEVIVSKATADIIGGEFVLRELDAVAVKGKKEPVRIFEVIGEKDAVSDVTLRFIEHFEKALALYRSQKFSEALDLFHELAHTYPSDASIQVFIERCSSFLESPPPADWTGAWVMTKK